MIAGGEKKEEKKTMLLQLGAKVVIFLSDLCTQKHLVAALHFSRASCQGYMEAS